VSDLVLLALALAAGLGLGAFYFGGLWLTIKRLPTARHPALLAMGSFCGRTVVVVGGIYLATGGADWRRVLACLAGFIAARSLMVRRLRPGRANG
jgi:F1F0 ATPase subunit 2